MGRMLEALKQIEANTAPSCDLAEPVVPGDVEAAVPDGPGEEAAGDDQVAEAVPLEGGSQPAAGTGSDRDVICLFGPMVERHRDRYRAVADNILAHVSPGRPAVFLFTSVGPREGKTVAVASLGAALAERTAGEVVAVDANFRNPTLAGHFGIWTGQGLVDVIAGNAKWRDVVRPTGVKRLSVLPGGRFAADEPSSSGDVVLSPVLDALQLRYGIVLVDAASLAYPEVAPVGRLCKGTYLVAELGHTPRKAARRAVRVLKRCGARVLGCVLTGEAA